MNFSQLRRAFVHKLKAEDTEAGELKDYPINLPVKKKMMDGLALSQKIFSNMKSDVAELLTQGIKPKLKIIWIGNSKPS